MSIIESALPLPHIVISHSDEPKLAALATAAAHRAPGVSAALLSELERAEVLPDTAMPPDAVRIGSTADVEIDDGRRLTLQLVLPIDADINAGRISILTPVGAALVGLSPGQRMSWLGNDGREHALTVLSAVGPKTH